MRRRLAQNLSYLNGDQARLIPHFCWENRRKGACFNYSNPWPIASNSFVSVGFGKNSILPSPKHVRLKTGKKKEKYWCSCFLQIFSCFIIWNELCLEILTFTIMLPLCRAYVQTYVWWTQKARVCAPIHAAFFPPKESAISKKLVITLIRFEIQVHELDYFYTKNISIIFDWRISRSCVSLD